MHVVGNMAASEYNGRPGGVQVGLWEGSGEERRGGGCGSHFARHGRQAGVGRRFVSFRFIWFLGGRQNENENEMVVTSR